MINLWPENNKEYINELGIKLAGLLNEFAKNLYISDNKQDTVVITCDKLMKAIICVDHKFNYNHNKTFQMTSELYSNNASGFCRITILINNWQHELLNRVRKHINKKFIAHDAMLLWSLETLQYTKNAIFLNLYIARFSNYDYPSFYLRIYANTSPHINVQPHIDIFSIFYDLTYNKAVLDNLAKTSTLKCNLNESSSLYEIMINICQCTFGENNYKRAIQSTDYHKLLNLKHTSIIKVN